MKTTAEKKRNDFEHASAMLPWTGGVDRDEKIRALERQYGLSYPTYALTRLNFGER